MPRHKRDRKGREAEILGKAGQGPRRITGGVAHEWSHSFVLCLRGGEKTLNLGGKTLAQHSPQFWDNSTLSGLQQCGMLGCCYSFFLNEEKSRLRTLFNVAKKSIALKGGQQARWDSWYYSGGQSMAARWQNESVPRYAQGTLGLT